MAEAQKGYAVLEDVDEGTFARFIEWAYKGYYTAAEFHLEPSSSPWPAEPSAEECDPTEYVPEPPSAESPREAEVDEPPADLPSESSKVNKWSKWGKKSKASRQELKETFIKRKHTVRREVISIAPTRANRLSNENYTEVFLSHARLYVFAEKYDIQLLAMLALENLHDTLALYTLYRERTRDIVDLLRYVYANTSEQPKGCENMRTLLKDYVGYEMKTLMTSKKFKALIIDDGGPLLDDFVKMVIKRID